MEQKHERLRKARAALYPSASRAAKTHNWTVSTYIAHENGQNDYSPEQAEIYGKAYKVSPEWLLFGGKAHMGIDAQLAMLPKDDADRLFEKFNAMIEGVRVVGKLK